MIKFHKKNIVILLKIELIVSEISRVEKWGFIHDTLINTNFSQKINFMIY